MAEKIKRMGKKDSPSREAFIDATERLLYREGWANVNARTVADEAGLKKQSLFYYFDSMDELIAETHSRHIRDFENGLDEVFASNNPLRAFWQLQLHGNGRLFTEFLAIANHSEVLKAMITESSARINKLVIRRVEKLLEGMGVDNNRFPPNVMVFILSAISNNYLIYKDLGILNDESDLLNFVDRIFSEFSSSAGSPMSP